MKKYTIDIINKIFMILMAIFNNNSFSLAHTFKSLFVSCICSK